MKTKLYLSSSSVKIMDVNDCVKIKYLTSLMGETVTFQVYVIGEPDSKLRVNVDSGLTIKTYQVFNKKSRQDFMPKHDDYYLTSKDDTFPDLLREVNEVTLDDKGFATLYFETQSAVSGKFSITINVGDEKVKTTLKVYDRELVKTDLLNTHWFHVDGICGYYKVKPFTKKFYEYFEKFIQSYAKMGNTALLIPLFTPPLDTGVGAERMTVQTVKVELKDGKYSFDFSETEKYIKIAQKYGIEYFEFSHLFTQWGGECCPKIIARENGKDKKIFGWDVKADDERYLSFLSEFLPKLVEFTKKTGIFGNSLIHLTDEPNDKSIAQYEKLSGFVRKYLDGMKTIDALSHFDFVEKGIIDLPAVVMNSKDFDKFSAKDRLLYYCTGVDEDCITNRYLTMPLLRTEVLGVQLYEAKSKGFLHWGYNYYNEQLTDICIDPYEDLSSNKKLPEGDCFLVYPGKDDVEYSIRYFAMLKAFEDYRLLKTLENKLNREKVLEVIKKAGFDGVHVYPKDVKEYEKFREYLRKNC